MKKRYQVFVSSTYKDLVEERQQVIQALLMLDCFPCGMEYFPAGDDEVWEAIKQLIDACDYYIVIIGGKYGSEDKAGVSYTQKEYEYAVAQGKRVAAFLHADWNRLPRLKTETTTKKVKKLEAFRKLCQKKMCAEWTSADDLKTKVLASLVKLMHQYPAVGWVPADLVPDESAAQTIVRLRNEIDELKKQSEAYRAAGPPDASGFAQGDEVVELRYTVVTSVDSHGDERHSPGLGTYSWNKIFLALAHDMLTAMTETDMAHLLLNMINEHGRNAVRIDLEDFQRVKIQLRARSYHEESKRRVQVMDAYTVWRGTTCEKHGDSPQEPDPLAG